METQTETDLEGLIKARIRAHGAMTVADYMQLALTHPEFGYYTRKDPLGAQGDFITSPEISQIFGEIVGIWIADRWHRMGGPQAALVELGPGRGTLMADLLRATKHIPDFHASISVHLVETSPHLRKKQWHAVAGKHPDVQWHNDINAIPAKPLLLIANEFFDALPIRQFLRTREGWQERMVALDENDALVFRMMPQKPPPAVRMQAAGPEAMIEYSPAAEHIAREICSQIDVYGGAALIVDYGAARGKGGDTLQAVRAHRYHDPLVAPGTADITAHVDFDLFRRAAAAMDLSAHGPVPQGVFLSALGAQMRAAKLCQNAAGDQKLAIISGLDRLLASDRMGDLFKVFAITAGEGAPEGFYGPAGY